MTQDDRMETITDPAEIRATSDERGCCDCRTFDQHERECILPDERTTPAPVGAAVGLNLDAIEARFADATADEVIYELWPALVAEVRRLTESRATVAANLSASLMLAEAEVVTLRAKLAAVEAVERGLSEGWVMLATVSDRAEFVRTFRAALATGEGQHVAREVFTADGIPFVRCSCTSAKSPTSSRWLAEHVPNGGVAELQAVVKRQAEGAKA